MLRKTRWQIAYLLGLSLHVAAVQAYASVAVEWKDERLSVAAEKVPLAQILREIAQRVRVEIRGGEGLQEQVSVCFVDLSLQEGLQKLSLNYVVLWKPTSLESRRPTFAMVSGRNGVPPAQMCPAQTGIQKMATFVPPQTPPTEQRQAAEEKLKLREATSALLTSDNRHEAIATLIAGTKSAQPKMRLEALRALSQSDHVEEDVSMSALQTALTDEDEEVRGYAELILQERAALSGE